MKEVAFTKYRKNLVLTVIYLKIPFHLYQPTFGRDEFFFPFSSKIPYAYFLNGLTPKKKKKNASNVLLQSTNIANKVYYVQTMQTKFARFRQKVLVIKLDSPKDFDKSTRLLPELISSMIVFGFKFYIILRLKILPKLV